MTPCRQCEAAATPIPVAVPDRFRGLLPGDPPVLGVCPTCLDVEPIEDVDAATVRRVGSSGGRRNADREGVDAAGSTPPEFDPGEISGSLPRSPRAALGVIVLLALCDSLAVNREEVVILVDELERLGVDPLTVLDRLADDPDLDLRIDAAGRRRQLEQLLP